MSKSYSWVFNKIKHDIQQNPNNITDELIITKIKDTKAIIDMHLDPKIPDSFRAHFFNDHNYEALNKDDWKRIEKDLRPFFFTSCKAGIGLKGKNSKNRNTKWWSEKFSTDKNFYWDRYREYIKTEHNPAVANAIDENSDFVLNHIGDPSLEEFSIFGMVVGHVQSGKTSNYSGVIAKAADAGYRIIIVIAGDKNNLRRQTQKEINLNFLGYRNEQDAGVGLIQPDRDKIPQSLTTEHMDFNTSIHQFATGLTIDNSRPNVFVIKKNTTPLQALYEWLSLRIDKKTPILIIDDESDYASVNYKDVEEPTRINSLIRKLAQISHKSSYIGYTATPFANIFIDHKAEHEEYGDDLFPSDFIHALEAPSNYFGSAAILSEGNREIYINEIDDHGDDHSGPIPLKHKIDFEITELPETLEQALRWFIIAVAIRNITGQRDRHKSMLIHVSRFKSKHSDVNYLVKEYLKELYQHAKSFINMPEGSNVINDLKRTFIKEYSNKLDSNEFSLSWSDIKGELTNAINSVETKEIHSDADEFSYEDENPSSVILIGGVSLSRGYVVKDLMVSYFIRNTAFYDTLMQMARWYGYREGYRELCRVYLTERMISNFQHIHNVTTELMDTFKQMYHENKTPEDFGLAVREHPDNILKVTALQKMKNTQVEWINIGLEGHTKQYHLLENNKKKFKENFTVTSDLLLKLNKDYQTLKNPEIASSSGFLWRDVSHKLVLDFLKKFDVFAGDGFGQISGMPVEFVKQYVEENHNWDIALLEGGQKNLKIIGPFEIRPSGRKNSISIKENGELLSLSNNRTVVTPQHEFINLKPHDYKKFTSDDFNKTRLAKEFPERNNLLMIYVIDASNSKDFERIANEDEIVTFCVSFSGSTTKTNHKSYRINTVQQSRMMQEIREMRENEENFYRD